MRASGLLIVNAPGFPSRGSTDPLTFAGGQDRRARDSRPQRIRRALCIGVDSYSDAPLVAGASDSRRWASALSDLGFRSSTLEDTAATRGAMLAAIESLLACTDDHGQVVIQFAGHTTVQSVRTEEGATEWIPALLPINYRSAGCVTIDDLNRLLFPHCERVGISLFIDGTLARSNAAAFGLAPAAGRAGERQRYLTIPADDAATRCSASAPPVAFRSVQRMTRGPAPAGLPWVEVWGCSQGEYAAETRGGGAFTAAALHHLPRAVAEGWRPARFIDAVRIHMASATHGHQAPRLQPLTINRCEQPLLGLDSTDVLPTGLGGVEALSLRELISAVDALGRDPQALSRASD